MRNYHRVLIVLAASAVIVAVLCWASSLIQTQLADERSAAEARTIALMAVYAVKVGDPGDVYDAFGQSLESDEASTLAAAIPQSLADDPRSFEASYFKPVGEREATVEVRHPADATFALLVSLRHDFGIGWRAISFRRTTPK
ncbi:MAG: hypothetical protein FDZ75_01715 [Actinobacteria bacterium]|nr:MAG: hypothetical protein FDZ75_01715 [Actinomycetota bacterium]